MDTRLDPVTERTVMIELFILGVISVVMSVTEGTEVTEFSLELWLAGTGSGIGGDVWGELGEGTGVCVESGSVRLWGGAEPGWGIDGGCL